MVVQLDLKRAFAVGSRIYHDNPVLHVVVCVVLVEVLSDVVVVVVVVVVMPPLAPTPAGVG